MGYQTEFDGRVTISPPLSVREIEYMNKFSNTRRMATKNGPYYVDNAGDYGQDYQADVVDFNSPPEGQPGLWCQWKVSADGTSIEWDGNEKFYNAAEWMEYIVDHFLGDRPISGLEFMTGHKLNGVINATGEEQGDQWHIIVADNNVTAATGHLTQLTNNLFVS